MEREKVIELAIKADDGFQLDPDDMYESLIGIDAVIRFARLVEQETLERAAKVCDSHLDFKEQEKADDAAWKSNKESIDVQIARFRHASDVRLYNCGIEKCIESIRDLKGNHDKE